MRRVFVWDLDNCLADDSWRIPLIDFDELDMDKRYWEYHAPSLLDAFPEEHKRVYKFTTDALKVEPWIVTARPERFRRITLKWLELELEPKYRPTTVLMRPDGDHSPSSALKGRLILAHKAQLPGQTDIVGAVDDHESVLETYRGLGIKAYHLSIHDHDAYRRPPSPNQPIEESRNES